jgi:lipopolysaccharide assembly outer membrane protein LptD (OstA)
MKRVLIASSVMFVIAIASLARQNPASQRLNLELGIPREAQPMVVLPRAGSRIQISASSIERNDSFPSVYRLNGSVEIRLPATLSSVTVLQADEATYDMNTGRIELGDNMRMSLQSTR